MQAPDPSGLIELRAVLKGEVQGVSFRATTRQLAERLHLRGTVRNCSDGTVEIIAQGSQEQVHALLTQLEQHFGPGKIQSIDAQYRPLGQLVLGFQIVH